MTQATMFEEAPAPLREGWTRENLGETFSSSVMEVVARKKIGASDAWKAFEFSVVDHKNVATSAIRIRGSIPIGKRRDGHPKWGKVSDADSVYIYQSEIDAAKLDYERETGKCAECVGGQYCSGFGVGPVYKYRPCTRCDGKGRPIVSVQRPSSEER